MGSVLLLFMFAFVYSKITLQRYKEKKKYHHKKWKNIYFPPTLLRLKGVVCSDQRSGLPGLKGSSLPGRVLLRERKFALTSAEFSAYTREIFPWCRQDRGDVPQVKVTSNK